MRVWQEKGHNIPLFIHSQKIFSLCATISITHIKKFIKPFAQKKENLTFKKSSFSQFYPCARLAMWQYLSLRAFVKRRGNLCGLRSHQRGLPHYAIAPFAITGILYTPTAQFTNAPRSIHFFFPQLAGNRQHLARRLRTE